MLPHLIKDPHARHNRQIPQARRHDTAGRMETFSRKFNVRTTVQIHNKTATSAVSTPEAQACHGITMVFADSVHNTVIVCIGSSLQLCDPPETAPQLLAGCREQTGFRDGPRSQARLSTVHGVCVDRNKVVLFTDWMNNCVRQIGTDGHVRTLYGAAPVSLHLPGPRGFQDGFANTARFHHPWGLCLYAEQTQIIVVDAHNSSIRRIQRSTAHVSTIPIKQDMSVQTINGLTEAPVPTQLLYPSTIHVARNGEVMVVSPSSHDVFRINLETMMFRSVSIYCGVDMSHRPVCVDVTASGKLLVGFTGYYYDAAMHVRDHKIVNYEGWQLYCADRNPVYYSQNSKLEICTCLCFSLAVNADTCEATLWISDCRAESRLLRVRLELKWEFLRVLLLGVLKPARNTLLALLPACTHHGRSVCPILQHIVRILQGSSAFA